MYDELVRCLRGHSQKMGCADNCICEDADKRGFGTCSEELAKLAADAIEERCQQLDKFAEEAARLYAKLPRWISVSERLPESMHEYVLCCGEKGGQFVGWVFNGMIESGKARAYQHGGRGRNITHWMPLPEPPKEET